MWPEPSLSRRLRVAYGTHAAYVQTSFAENVLDWIPRLRRGISTAPCGSVLSCLPCEREKLRVKTSDDDSFVSFLSVHWFWAFRKASVFPDHDFYYF